MCENLATHRYTWPGNDEQLICDEHLPKLQAVANCMGFYLQVIPLSEADRDLGLKCAQKGSVEQTK